MYKSKMHNASQTKQILENDSQDVMFKVYHKVKDKRDGLVKKHKQERMTLTKLAEKMDAGFKQVNSRIDRIEMRIDGIDARLDYIVDENHLKDNK